MSDDVNQTEGSFSEQKDDIIQGSWVSSGM
jgi:hypothetical protein